MNFFCRILGHTWVPEATNPKIRWHTDKDGVELKLATDAEPELYDRCARCKERRSDPQAD